MQKLSAETTVALPWVWPLWALPHQVAPAGSWRTWVVLGGRGAGKTRAGAEWIRAQVEGNSPTCAGRARRVALLGETLDQARDVMVFGDSGLLAISPPDRRPEWQASRKRLVWPNGATAQIFSAREPEALRGPQFDVAWADELGKWPKADAPWEMLQFALRLGAAPQQVVTTTPRNQTLLKDLLALESTVQTHAATADNRAHLAPAFLKEITRRYAGTRLGRQELNGEFCAEEEGALWTRALLDSCLTRTVPELDRIVIALDPPVSHSARSDACGIVVAGIVAKGAPQDWQGYVLADLSHKGAPADWIATAVAAMARFGADRLVAEVNQGGDLIETLLRQVSPMTPYKAVRATVGKAARAEPIAALYEQGRVRHVAGLSALEDEMCQMVVTGFQGKGSPDRLDALTWALHDLMIVPAQRYAPARIRGI